MELTSEEKEMLRRIVSNQYTGGGYKRATWVEMICRTGRGQGSVGRALPKRSG